MSWTQIWEVTPRALLKNNCIGTNLLEPVTAILNEKTMEGFSRQLFILTDGYLLLTNKESNLFLGAVSDSEQCLNAVRKHANSTRVFTFGIGEVTLRA